MTSLFTYIVSWFTPTTSTTETDPNKTYGIVTINEQHGSTFNIIANPARNMPPIRKKDMDSLNKIDLSAILAAKARLRSIVIPEKKISHEVNRQVEHPVLQQLLDSTTALRERENEN